ncbi:MFS transporter [Jiella mangrovi]|uniref:MFS transporter n=1 Tax=Jiella mangrovi TaxID=2821407 RepID=A0ABS4BLJ3_9HYPH|nr:MFS transporter [Jiella mangrovi]MBP0617593.1 MFS transporter [Jiella mangrovi]
MIHATATSDSRSEASLALVTICLACGGFTLGAGEFSAMSLLPYYADGLGVSESVAGYAVSAYAVGVMIGAPLIAVLAARWPRKYTLIGLMLVVAAGYALSAFAPSILTLDAARFLAGLPHGAYFGIAILFAADIAGKGKRAQATSHIMLGLAVATVVGVPAVNAFGQSLGWRLGFAIVAGLAALTALGIWLTAPYEGPDPSVRPLKQFRALANRQVLLVLAMGAVGYGGTFAIYSYFSAAFLQTVDEPQYWISIGLVIYGLGVVFGNWVAGKLTGGRVLQSAAAFQAVLAISGLIYAASIGSMPFMFAALFLIGVGGGLVVPLQTRLMDVAGEAQTMAAAMNHAAFNAANALGPLLAGFTLSAGLGWASTGYVGVALSLGGLAIWLVILATSKRSAQ